MLKGVKRGLVTPFLQGLCAREPRFSLRFAGWLAKQKALVMEGLQPLSRAQLLLQLPLQDFDLVGQHGVVADQSFDLAHRMQHGGVVAPAEPPADFRQRT